MKPLLMQSFIHVTGTINKVFRDIWQIRKFLATLINGKQSLQKVCIPDEMHAF